MKHIEKIVDTVTGEESIIERELTADEIASINKHRETIAKEQAEIAAKKNARLAILEKLGLTEEEAAVLLG